MNEYTRPMLPHDEPEPLPAAWMIALSHELGDDEPDDMTQDDG